MMSLIEKLSYNDRPREKALIYGVETLSNAELIAILICTGSKKSDALELSQNIVNDAGSLLNLSNYSIQELQMFRGIKKVKAMRIKVAFELHNRIEKERNQNKIKISSLGEASLFIRSSIINFKQENLLLLMLNNSNEVLCIKNISTGSDTSVLFSIKNIVSTTLKMGASRLIIAHNHPSNNVNPSSEDIDRTEELKLLSSVVGIDFIDHLILTEYGYFSISNNLEYKY